MKFQGSFPALITPYSENNRVNFKEIENLVNLHQNYSDGLVIFGSTGEGWLLSEDEQRAIIRTIKKQFSKTVIASVNAWTPDEFTKKSLFFNDESSLDAVMLAAPPYLKLNEHQVLKFFETCASASPCPVIIYHIPARNNVVFTPRIMQLLSEHPNIIGIKETIWSNWLEYQHLPGLIRFAGEDSFLSHSFVTNSINVGGNIYPWIFSTRPDEFNFNLWQELILNKGANPLIIKDLMTYAGLIHLSNGREPLGKLERFKHEELIHSFNEYFSYEHLKKLGTTKHSISSYS